MVRVDPLLEHYPVRIREVTIGVILGISFMFYIFPRFLGESEKMDYTIIEEIESFDIPQTEQIKIPEPPARPSVPVASEDEFFDDDIMAVCQEIARAGKRVVIAGLEKDFMALPFGPMPELLVDAEYITKVNAICMICGVPANFSQRISNETNQVVVGETDKYEARCRKCFLPIPKEIK